MATPERVLRVRNEGIRLEGDRKDPKLVTDSEGKKEPLLDAAPFVRGKGRGARGNDARQSVGGGRHAGVREELDEVDKVRELSERIVSSAALSLRNEGIERENADAEVPLPTSFPTSFDRREGMEEKRRSIEETENCVKRSEANESKETESVTEASLRAENALLRALVEKVKDSELQLAEKEAQDAYARYVVQFEAMADALTQEEARRRSFEFDYAKAEAEKREAQGRVTKLIEERQILEGKIREAAHLSELAERERQQAEVAQKEMLDACRRLEEELQALHTENEKAHEVIQELESEVDAKKAEIKRLEDESEELAEELVHAESNIGLAQAEQENLRSHVAQLEERIQELSNALEQAEEQVRVAEDSLLNAQEDCKHHQAEIDQIQEALSDQENMLEDANLSKHEVEKELEQIQRELKVALERAEQAEVALKDANVAHSTLQEEHIALRKTLQESQERSASFEATLATLRSEQSNSHQHIADLQSVLEEAEKRVKNSQTALQEAQDANNKHVKQCEDLQHALHSAEMRAEKISLSLDDLKQAHINAEEESDRLKAALAEAIARGQEALKESRDAEILAEEHLVLQGAAASAKQHAITLEQSLREAQIECADLHTKVKQLELDMLNAKEQERSATISAQKAKEAIAALDAARESIVKRDIELEDWKEKLRANNAELASMRTRLEHSCNRVKSLEGEKALLQENIQYLSSSLTESKQQCTTAKEDNLALQGELNSLQADNRALQERNERLKTALEDAMEELISVRMLWENSGVFAELEGKQPLHLNNAFQAAVGQRAVGQRDSGASSRASFDSVKQGPAKSTSQGAKRTLLMHDPQSTCASPPRCSWDKSELGAGLQPMQVVGFNPYSPKQPCTEWAQSFQASHPHQVEGMKQEDANMPQEYNHNPKVNATGGYIVDSPSVQGYLTCEQKPPSSWMPCAQMADGSTYQYQDLTFGIDSTQLEGCSGQREFVCHVQGENDSDNEVLIVTCPRPTMEQCPSPIHVRTPVVPNSSPLVDTATNTTPSLQLRAELKGCAPCKSYKAEEKTICSPSGEELASQEESDGVTRQAGSISGNSSVLSTNRFRLRMHMKLRRSAFTSGNFGVNAQSGHPAVNSRVSRYALASLESPA